MNDIILLKVGEIILKGLNRRRFEQKLLGNIRWRLGQIGKFRVYILQSTIYVEGEEGADMDSIFGSYLHFSLKAGVGATYDYFIKEGQQVTGRVESYNEGESERQYVLDRFFEGRDNALLRIIDMPNCDNLKVAVIQYADEKKDSTGIFLQYILTDDESDKMPQQ